MNSDSPRIAAYDASMASARPTRTLETAPALVVAQVLGHLVLAGADVISFATRGRSEPEPYERRASRLSWPARRRPSARR
jgi:hypothetical protein